MFSIQGDPIMREREWMKRIVAAVAITVMMMPYVCRGEEKLFVTDVLEKGEREVVVALSYLHEAHEISYESIASDADRTLEATFSTCALNMGVGHGFELGASIPYVFSERSKIEYPTVPAITQRFNREGFGDISVRGRYLIFDETDKPFALAAGLDVKLDTASEDDGGTGTTNIAPYLAASTSVAEGIRPFAMYTFVARNHGSRDSHEFILGAEKEVNEDVGLQAFLEADLHTSSDYFESFESYYLNVSSYVRICGNFYAVPRVVYGILTSSDEKESDRSWDTANRLRLTFGLYCLF